MKDVERGFENQGFYGRKYKCSECDHAPLSASKNEALPPQSAELVQLVLGGRLLPRLIAEA